GAKDEPSSPELNKIGQMRIRDATCDDVARLKMLLPKALALDFDPEPVVEEKLFGPGYGGAARCRVALVEDSVRGVAVACGSALRVMAVEPSFRRRGLGSALLDDVVRQSGPSLKRIIVGAAAGNYVVPGIPSDHHESIEFFRKRGFRETVRTTDMKVAVGDVSRPEPMVDVEINRVETFDGPLERFLSSEFGESIAWEIGHGLSRGRAVVRTATSDGAIAGFTACEINNAGIGTFGPQGVTPASRGKGLGSLLLRHSLADLRELGYLEARIPWVSAVDYYERSCGATVAGTYVVMRRG
ncbi:MAG: GNAT family N-acetyltransferase, partial [Acidobacteria bacterium]|nr:GNAT family N-acetyltransferase [Acidobacteriota bacterium]